MYWFLCYDLATVGELYLYLHAGTLLTVSIYFLSGVLTIKLCKLTLFAIAHCRSETMYKYREKMNKCDELII